jgi:DNA-binding beta-propeller fold protein YncE
VFTFNAGSSDATAIDPKSDAVVGTVKLDGKPEFGRSDGKGNLYVNLEDKSRIEKVDLKSLKVTGSWPLAPGESPTGLAIDTKRGLLFSACDNGMMTVSDIRSGKVVSTPKIGNGPDGAAFDPGTGLAFSPNGQDGTLTVIGPDFAVLQTVVTQKGARTMALDTKTHKIYLIAAQYEPGEQGQRPRMVPGSATILVVAPVKR